jgi:hypothetical protein
MEPFTFLSFARNSPRIFTKAQSTNRTPRLIRHVSIKLIDMPTQRVKQTRREKEGGRERRLADLSGIGAAMLRDFELLGIRSVEQLAKADGQKLYDRLRRVTGTRQDPCVLDTFVCAVAQAQDPKLPKAQRN